VAGISLAALLFVAYLSPGTALAQIIDFQELSDEAGTFPVALDDVTGNDDDFGEAAGAIGDLDGDSVPDIVLTAQDEDAEGINTGAIWITFLKPDGTVKRLQEISNTEPSGFSAELSDGAQFGGQVGNLGDLDGDGITDIAVSSRPDGDDGTPEDGGTPSTGAFWILFLNEDGFVKRDQKISLNEGGLLGGATGAQPGSWFGEMTASPLGDLDLDGVPDTVVGARSDDDGGLNRGAVHVLFLNSDGTVKKQQKISDTQGGFTGQLDDGDVFGDEVEVIGDVNGDGIPDVAAFAKGDDDGRSVDVQVGAVWILFLNRDGTVQAHQKISETAGGFTPPLQNYSAFGETIVGMGDLDGDGVPDIAVGADYHDDGAKDTGALWLLYLNRNGTVKSHQQIGSMTPEFAGVLGSFDNFGNDGANIGDLNGDGVADLVVTADSDDGVGRWIPEGEYGHAAAYIFFLEGVLPRTDFVVTNITLSPTSPAAGATFSASVTVRNQGTASGSGGNLSVWVNQAAAASCGATGTQQLSVGTLAAGASRTLTFTGLPAGIAGTSTFRAFVDSACVTLESNEANNQLTRTYTVTAGSALPDFVVTGITLTPASPTAGGTFSAAVTVKNQGAVSASGGYLSVYRDRTTTAACGFYGNQRKAVGTLAAGASTTLIFTGIQSGTAGTRSFFTFVDSACTTAESDESNNQRTLRYSVLP
jgi:hypothetical protein